MIWPFRKPRAVEAPKEAPEPRRPFSTVDLPPEKNRAILTGAFERILRALPSPSARGEGMDHQTDSIPAFKRGLAEARVAMPEALAAWYASQGFIGHQMCAILAQNWLIDKACSMPARDALRHGWKVVTKGGDALDPEILEGIEDANKRFDLMGNLAEYVRMGRIFGVRVMLFQVDSTDPEYYEKPFNPDGITPGSYRGMVQIDPYWMSPELDARSASDPAYKYFYEPTWWTIAGKRYHRSHLCIFRAAEVPDILKPAYLYGGVPVPQRVMERIYCAERTANEGPQLAMTKRLTVQKVHLEDVLGDQAAFLQHMEHFSRTRDNYGVMLVDKEHEVQQHDASLADLDAVIMTQYQLVAAAANVPATKLLGTTPKGFNATGEYEERSYHEELGTIQTHDLTPVIERHLLCVQRSILQRPDLEMFVEWMPLDVPSAKELAETAEIDSRTALNYVNMGALDGLDVRAKIAADPRSGYAHLPDPVDEDFDDDPTLNP